MTDKKFTDEEIIKRLERCVHRGNRNYDTDIVLDLINRQQAENLELRLKVNELLAYKQEVTKNNIKNYETYKSQKAEIERLKECPKCVYEYDGEVTEYCVQGPCSNFKTVEQIKAEAYKEFAEKLKKDLFYKCGDINYSETCDFRKLIDNLLKEMVGEEE